MSKYEAKLKSLLCDMHLVDDFVDGILAFAYHPQDQKALIEFIEAGEDVDLETIAIAALEMFNRRNS